MLTIVVLHGHGFHTQQLHGRQRFQPLRRRRACSPRSRRAASSSRCSASSRPTSSRARAATRKRDIPRAVIGVDRHRRDHLHPAAGRVPRRAARVADRGTWAHGAGFTTFSGPFAQLATLVGLGWLATILYIDAVISPAGTGLIYMTGASRVSYGLSRNGYVPSVFETIDRRGVPWVGLITAFIVGCICFLPFPSWRSLVGLITSASVLMYAGAPLSLGAFRQPPARRRAPVPAARRARILAPLAFVVANLLILWSGWTTDWKLGVAILIGYAILIANRCSSSTRQAPARPARRVWLPSTSSAWA